MKMNKNLWEAGDFSRIAPGAQIVGELLCDAVPVYAGDRVLDIGCGTSRHGPTSLMRAILPWPLLVAVREPQELTLLRSSSIVHARELSSKALKSIFTWLVPKLCPLQTHHSMLLSAPSA